MLNGVTLSLIVARARNGVIGVDGKLPWRLKSDMAFFKAVTMGKPVVMGRKTWESLPKRPLAGRDNIVLSRDWNYNAAGARVYSSGAAAFNAAKAMAGRKGLDEAFVIGGESVYMLALPYADRLYISEVETTIEGDAGFPNLVMSEWTETASERFEASDGNEFAFVLRRLERVNAGSRIGAK